jgi:hypothetical protein
MSQVRKVAKKQLQVTRDVVFDEHRAWKWKWGEESNATVLQRCSTLSFTPLPDWYSN